MLRLYYNFIIIFEFQNKQNEKKQIYDIASRYSNTKHYFILHRESISIF